MWLSRFALFTIYESPKYLMGKGRDEEAVKVVHEVARRNKKTSPLTIDDLKACESIGGAQTSVDTSNAAALKRQMQKLNLTHVRALFSTKKLAFSTSMIMAVWGFSKSPTWVEAVLPANDVQSAWPIHYIMPISHSSSLREALSLEMDRPTLPIATHSSLLFLASQVLC